MDRTHLLEIEEYDIKILFPNYKAYVTEITEIAEALIIDGYLPQVLFHHDGWPDHEDIEKNVRHHGRRLLKRFIEDTL